MMGCGPVPAASAVAEDDLPDATDSNYWVSSATRADAAANPKSEILKATTVVEVQ
jgi:hypothetical protein